MKTLQRYLEARRLLDETKAAFVDWRPMNHDTDMKQLQAAAVEMAEDDLRVAEQQLWAFTRAQGLPSVEVARDPELNAHGDKARMQAWIQNAANDSKRRTFHRWSDGERLTASPKQSGPVDLSALARPNKERL